MNMKRLSLLVLPLIVGSFFIFPIQVSAALLTDWSEDFDSYTLGDLNGQGGWSATTAYDVVSGGYVDKGLSVAVNTTDADLTGLTDLIAEDVVTLKASFMVSDVTNTTMNAYARMRPIAGGGCALALDYEPSDSKYEIYIDGPTSLAVATSTNFVSGQWYTAYMEIDNINDTCTVYFQGEEATIAGPVMADITHLEIRMDNVTPSSDAVYIDEIEVYNNSFSSIPDDLSETRPYVTYVTPENHEAITNGNFDIEFTINDPFEDEPDAYEFWLFKNNGNNAQTISLQNIAISGGFPSSQSVPTIISEGLYELVVTPYSTVTGQEWSNNGIQFSVGVGTFQDQYEDLYSNLYASSTQATCSSPSSILDVGGGIRYSFCQLFVPNQSTLNQFSNLSIADKFPLAYVTDLNTIFSDNLVASTTNFATSTISLTALNIGTGTGIGNILPDISFGKGTVMQYLGQTNYNIFMLFQAAGFYLALMFYMYRRVVGFFEVKTT